MQHAISHHKPLAGVENLIRIYCDHNSLQLPAIKKVHNFIDSLCNILMVTTISHGVAPGTFEVRAANGTIYSIHENGSNEAALHALENSLRSLLKDHGRRDRAAEAHHHNHAPSPHYNTQHHDLSKAEQQLQQQSLRGIETHLKIKLGTNGRHNPQVNEVMDFLGKSVNLLIVTTSINEDPSRGDFELFRGGELLWSLKKEGCSQASFAKLMSKLQAVKKEADNQGYYRG